jgi:hypothetical protein
MMVSWHITYISGSFNISETALQSKELVSPTVGRLLGGTYFQETVSHSSSIYY